MFCFGLRPAFRRGSGLGVGFEVQVKVNQSRSTRFVIGNTACEGLACEPGRHPSTTPPSSGSSNGPPVSAHASPPPPAPHPYQTIPCGGGGPGTPDA